jgi:hypothetical protein
MDRKELDALWLKENEAALASFIEKNIGYKQDAQSKERRPACFGSGDDQNYCKLCAYRSQC